MPFRPARAEVELDPDSLGLRMPDGWVRRHTLNGVSAVTKDGFVAAKMLVLERDAEEIVVITPPDQGAVAPNVVRVPEAPPLAAIVDAWSWEALSDWLLGGCRLAALSISDLSRLACIATPHFAALIGEVAGERALELMWAHAGPLRGGHDVDEALSPLTEAARSSSRAAEALFSALAHAAGARRRRARR